jgi:hypothetical protein
MPKPSLRAIALLTPMLLACGGQGQAGSPASGAPAPAPQSISVNDGESLVRAMYARHASRWYHNLTFVQSTTLFSPSGGTPTTQTWYETISLPGHLRIDYGNPQAGNGLLYNADNNYQFINGTLSRSANGWSETNVLTQAVYAQPPEVTISVLRSLGYQMSRLRIATFEGKSSYIVGSATNSDTSSKQFWVERDRLVLVRMMEKRPDGNFTEVRLGGYTEVGTGWIAKQVVQLSGGRPRLLEQVSNITADIDLDPALFDPKQWSTARHWVK